jgi:hypothetical protein
MIFSAVTGLLIGALVGGLAAYFKIMQRLHRSLQVASDGYRAFFGAATDDQRQELSKKIGLMLIFEGAKSCAIFGVALALFLVPMWFVLNMIEAQLLYVLTAAISGIVAFGMLHRVVG